MLTATYLAHKLEMKYWRILRIPVFNTAGHPAGWIMRKMFEVVGWV